MDTQPSGGLPPLPPPPLIQSDQTLGSPFVQPTVKAWEKTLVVLGVIWCFTFFLTIPGWFALKRYRRWMSGELGRPTLLMPLGVVMTTLFVIGTVVALAVPPTTPSAWTPRAATVGSSASDTSSPTDFSVGAAMLVGPDHGQCGHQEGSGLTWIPNACFADDDVIVVAVLDLPYSSKRGPARHRLARSVAAFCPGETEFFTWYVAEVACWAHRYE